jgi:transcriptional regulator with XRE-family HTH domain
VLTGRDKFSEDYRKLLSRLIAARHAMNMTQAQVALELGIRQPMLSKVEAGQQQLGLLDFVRYCRAVSLDPQECLRTVADVSLR